MDYFRRYLNGEHRQVTADLTRLDLSASIALSEEATAVAELLMTRVAENCSLIADRLTGMRYIFSVYCDASDDGGAQVPILPYDKTNSSALGQLKSKFDAIPLSIEYFWRKAGGIAFTGTHPDFPNMLDPLVIYPAEAVLEEASYAEQESDGSFHMALSPDDYHKDNVSGGMPYSIALPKNGFDFELLYEKRKTFFIEYLRDVILLRGGFAALDSKIHTGVPLEKLTAGLLPF